MTSGLRDCAEWQRPRHASDSFEQVAVKGSSTRHSLRIIRLSRMSDEGGLDARVIDSLGENTKVIGKRRRALARQVSKILTLETVKAPPRPKWHLPLTDRDGRSIETFDALLKYVWEQYGNRTSEVAEVLYNTPSGTRPVALKGDGGSPLIIPTER